MLTYGDGVSTCDLRPVAGVPPGARQAGHGHRGAPAGPVRRPRFDGDRVAEFTEKPQIGEGWINGGFFVLEPRCLRLPRRATQTEPGGAMPSSGWPRTASWSRYRHDGFWQCMDTLRDKRLLEALWEHGEAPWKVW